MSTVQNDPAVALKSEIMLLINQRIFERGVISKEVYEQAKIEIVNRT